MNTKSGLAGLLAASLGTASLPAVSQNEVLRHFQAEEMQEIQGKTFGNQLSDKIDDLYKSFSELKKKEIKGDYGLQTNVNYFIYPDSKDGSRRGITIDSKELKATIILNIETDATEEKYNAHFTIMEISPNPCTIKYTKIRSSDLGGHVFDALSIGQPRVPVLTPSNNEEHNKFALERVTAIGNYLKK